MNHLQGTRGTRILSQCAKHYIQNHGMKTMQAWQINGYGGTERLHLTETKVPVVRTPIDILVKVHAASVNPLDVRMLEGYGATTFNFMRKVNRCSMSTNEFPLTLGRDFSGTVVHVGQRVKNIKPGDEVWGASSPWDNGSHAEYVMSSVCNVSKKPTSIGHVESAAIPYAGLTAWTALACFGGVCEKNAHNKKVLVLGASGGVGSFAVQLLKAWGADVYATCSADAVEMVQNLGVHNVIAYQDQDFRRHLQELKGLDLILDCVGGDYPAQTIDLLKPWRNTKYVTLVSPLLKDTDENGLLLGAFKSASQAALDTVMSVKDGTSFRWAYFIINGCVLKTIAQMVDNKQITPIIEKTYSFDATPKAYDKVNMGHARGKIVIDVAGEHKQHTEGSAKDNTSTGP